MRIAFIGLGNMGRPMATNLVRKGFQVVVHDVNPRPVHDLTAAGARAGSVRDAASASKCHGGRERTEVDDDV